MGLADIKRQESFDVFYINYNEDNGTYETENIEARPPVDELLIQFQNHFEDLINLDIKNFSFIIFIEDLEKLSVNELEYFWVKFFENWLTLINEEYLTIDFDEIRSKFRNTNDKKLFIKKIVFFVMQLFPYYIFSNYLIDKDFEDKNSVLNHIKKMNKYDKQELIKYFNRYKDKFVSYKESFKSLEKYIKKAYKDQIFVEEKINQQLEFLNIFKHYLEETDIEKLRNILIDYIENDFENLI